MAMKQWFKWDKQSLKVDKLSALVLLTKVEFIEINCT